jgi:hypothetical protein
MDLTRMKYGFPTKFHHEKMFFDKNKDQPRRECAVSQHKLVVVDFCFRVHLQRSKHVQAPRMKWWKHKEEAAKTFNERVLKEGPWHEGADENSMWMKKVTCIRKVALEEFGVTKGGKHEAKETWWWNEKAQNAIKEKKE